MIDGALPTQSIPPFGNFTPIDRSSPVYVLPGARRRRSPARLFTPREIEVLEWVAKGKTDWQVGQILLISRKTVNYHVERAKQKLSVPTRTQAVLAAVSRGLVTAAEPG